MNVLIIDPFTICVAIAIVFFLGALVGYLVHGRFNPPLRDYIRADGYRAPLEQARFELWRERRDGKWFKTHELVPIGRDPHEVCVERQAKDPERAAYSARQVT